MCHDFNTDYHVYCRFCGRHNLPYRTSMDHAEDCLGLKLLSLCFNSDT
jgi:hypothetical protein